MKAVMRMGINHFGITKGATIACEENSFCPGLIPEACFSAHHIFSTRAENCRWALEIIHDRLSTVPWSNPEGTKKEWAGNVDVAA